MRVGFYVKGRLKVKKFDSLEKAKLFVAKKNLSEYFLGSHLYLCIR